MATPTPQTVIYKTVKGNSGEEIEIPLDVYLPSSPSANSSAPVPLIWIHTGGFLQGTRKFAPGVSAFLSLYIYHHRDTKFVEKSITASPS